MSEVQSGRLPPVYAPPPGEKWQKYVFISYNHKDANFIYEDLRVLAENGARFWYDEDIHAGDDWIKRATERINDPNCSGILFYFTVNSLGSEAVFEEFKLAKEREEKDRTFIIDRVNAPNETTFQLLKKTDAPEERFHKFIDAFPGSNVHIGRTTEPFYWDHLEPLVGIFKKADAIDESQCSILQQKNFKHREINGEIEITNYIGKDSVFSVPATIGGKRVVSIGVNAFKDNKHIKQIRIPEGVERIDDYAFSGCNSLEIIVLPNSLQTLGYETFRDCSELKSIEIPRNVHLIGEYCFYRCHKLKDIQLHSEVPLTLAFAAFSECQAMESLILPESTDSIETYVFNYCINLKSITIPRNVRYIGHSAFYSCTSLEEVCIHADVALENNELFSRCRNLNRITFRAGKMADYKKLCSWDEHRDIIRYELDAPRNIKRVEDRITWEPSHGAESYIVHLNDKEQQTAECSFPIPKDESCGSYTILIQAQPGDAIMIPSAFSEEVCIERNIWETNEKGTILKKYNGKEEKVTIPEGITEIAEEAFFNHDGVEEVIFHEGLRIIGHRAFYHCTRLKKIEFPASLRTIGDEAFLGTSISELTIPEGVSTIGESCFASCNDLKTLVICAPGLMAREKAFYRCINLKSVTFPRGFHVLHAGMFRGCTELSKIDLPEELHTIRKGAISYIMRLEKICIPARVTTIDAGAFSNSFGFTSISVAEGNQSYCERNGVLLRKNPENTIVQFPADMQCTIYTVDADVSEIGAYAFMDAEHLREVIITGKMEEIGLSAFERCPNLEKVVIEKELEYIRKNAFKDCFKLRSLYLMGSVVPELDSSSFENASDRLKIYIPQRYINKYYRDSEWKKIENRLVSI